MVDYELPINHCRKGALENTSRDDADIRDRITSLLQRFSCADELSPWYTLETIFARLLLRGQLPRGKLSSLFRGVNTENISPITDGGVWPYTQIYSLQPAFSELCSGETKASRE